MANSGVTSIKPRTPSTDTGTQPFTQQRATKRVAVITGASSGLGEVYARQLAAQGHDLLLTARRQEQLERLGDEVRDSHGVRTEICTADLACAADRNRLVQRILEMPDLEYLINNAGFGTMGNFEQVQLERHQQMIEVHIRATVELTYAALPKMLEQNRGKIINVASVAAFLVGPGQAMYNATKAFVKSFSESLHAEVAKTGVQVQALCPGITRTGFHETPDFEHFDRSQMPRGLWMKADEVVETSLRKMQGRNRAICIPGIKNRLLTALFAFGPIRNIAGQIIRKEPK